MSSPRLPAKLITRRELTVMVAVAAPALVQATAAQQAPAEGTSAPKSPEEKLQQATEHVRRVSETLSKLEVPMNVEPAFSFRP